MSKVILVPLRLGAGLLAGIAGKQLFNILWRLIDDEQPPKAEDRRIRLPKLALALALDGAIFRASRGLADHGTRRVLAGLTGSWPGDDE